MEENLKKWVENYLRIHKLFPQRTSIKYQARRLSKIQKFKASKGWLDKFLKRTGLDKTMRFYQSQFEEEEEQNEMHLKFESTKKDINEVVVSQEFININNNNEIFTEDYLVEDRVKNNACSSLKMEAEVKLEKFEEHKIKAIQNNNYINTF